MSFWSTLGKIGSVAAAPFTGGASLSALPVIDALGNVLGGAAKGSADQRMAEVPGMVNTYNANLNGQQFNANEQDRGFKRQMLASLLGGVQDASISRPEGSTIPNFQVSGGLRPSAISGKDSLIASLGAPTMSAPSPLEMPKAGLGEKIMGGIGLGANILGAIGKSWPKQSPATPPFVPQGSVNPDLMKNVRF